MDYLDNPRKIHGRVDIIYSDSQIASDITAASNSLAVISHPDEVSKGYLEPTVKACTLDGNATMNGTFQMMEDGCVVGWWSNSRCNANGNFIGIKPYLHLSFVQKPVLTWTLIGDIKLGQFPVDFTVEYYSESVVAKTDTVTDNDSVEVKFEPHIEDITSIKLTVSKWNTPNACVKILKFYDRLFERYEGDAVQMFEVTEEMGSADGSYNINSDVMTVSLHNLNRKFDKGYLRSLMILDRKLIAYLGTEQGGGIDYTQLGTFYSDEWKISQDSQWVVCTASDRLMRLQEKTYIGFPYTENVTVKEVAEDILSKLGLKPEEYIVSEGLNDIVIPCAFMPKCSFWDALQEIANAALCRVYVDRYDRIVVTDESESTADSGLEINGGNMFSAVSNITLTEFANSVNVGYNEVALANSIITAAETTVTLSAGESLKMSLDYASEIADAWAESDNASIGITGFTSGVNAGEFTVTNIGTGFLSAKITVTGFAVSVSTVTVTARDEESIKQFGVTSYSHPTSELVRSYEHAMYIATKLLSKLHAGEGVVTAVWRGNPNLELGAEYGYTDRFGEYSRLVCEYNKYTYDGSLKHETRGRKK